MRLKENRERGDVRKREANRKEEAQGRWRVGKWDAFSLKFYYKIFQTCVKLEEFYNKYIYFNAFHIKLKISVHFFPKHLSMSRINWSSKITAFSLVINLPTMNYTRFKCTFI